jgi:hypothetical protein
MMTRAAGGMRRRQSYGNNPWTAGARTKTNDPNLTSHAAATFEWPPPDEVLSSQVVRFTIEPIEHAPETGAVASGHPPVPQIRESDGTAGIRESAANVDPWQVPNDRHSLARPSPDSSAASPERSPERAIATSTSISWYEVFASSIHSPAIMGALAALLLTVFTGVALARRTAPRPLESAFNSFAFIVRGLSAIDLPVREAGAPGARDESRITQKPVVPHTPPGRKASDDRAAQVLPMSGRLVVNSDPAGAEIFLDGRYQGVTPKTLGGLAPGRYRIVLRREGREVQHKVSVGRGATVALVAPLESSSSSAGWVSIASPLEMDVFEHGVLVGTSRSPRIMLEAGLHSLELVNEQTGFSTTRQVRVRSERVEQIGVEAPLGTAHLNAIPWAEVWIDGRSVGQTPIGNLPVAVGRHEIVFRHPQLGEKRILALVRFDTPTRLTANLRQPDADTH